MGKKFGCCKKKASSNKCDDSSSSSSSSCSSSSYYSSSCSSSNYAYCCTKYPKCHCKVSKCEINKCAPIYYPNNCVGQYPYNTCRPHCPPNPGAHAQCSPTYNSYISILAGSSISFNLSSQYTLYIVNPTDTSGNLYLPTISSLSTCCYNKMFVISNISLNTIIVNTSSSGSDSINGLTNITIPANSSVNIYSSNISGVGYWSLV